MIVKIVTYSEKEIERRDYRDSVRIYIDGKKVLDCGDGEHEDNTLGRNFSDCYSIPQLMEKAFDAGRAGQGFEIVEEEMDE